MNGKFRLGLVVAGCVVLLVFALFSREVKRGFLKQTDFNTSVRVQDMIDKSTRLRAAAIVGDVMEGSTFFASPEMSVGLIVLLTILAFVTGKGKKRFAALAIPVLFAFLVLGEIYGKNVVHHPAPPFFMIKNPTTPFPKYYINEAFSYPSGHAARAVFIALTAFALAIVPLCHCALATILRNKRVITVAALGVAYVTLVSVSRIYLGHHWLSDILGGWMLAGGSSLLLAALVL